MKTRETTKEKCVRLRKQDKTLTEIMKKTGLPKTTIWYHIINIPLTPKKKKGLLDILLIIYRKVLKII